MSLSIDQQLRQTFALATLRQQAGYLKKPEHWARASEVQEHASKLRKKEEDDYANRYATRVEVAVRRLMHDAGSRNRRDYNPAGTGTDRFSPDALERQAQREVRQAHERRTSRIGLAEQRLLTAIVQEAAQQNAIRGLAMLDFKNAHDNQSVQSGPTKPGPSHS